MIPGAPAAYFARLPVKELAQAIRDAGVPAQVSNSAGLFVCNALLCRLLYEIETHYPQMRGGFLHVPCLPEQAERLGKGAALPSLTLPEIVLSPRPLPAGAGGAAGEGGGASLPDASGDRPGPAGRAGLLRREQRSVNTEDAERPPSRTHCMPVPAESFEKGRC